MMVTNMRSLMQGKKGSDQLVREGGQEQIDTIYLTKHPANYAPIPISAVGKGT